MPLPFLAMLAITLVLDVVAYVMMPKPKQAKPDAVKDLDSPQAKAGIEAGVIFGTVLIKDANIIWYGDKTKKTYKVKV